MTRNIKKGLIYKIPKKKDYKFPWKLKTYKWKQVVETTWIFENYQTYKSTQNTNPLVHYAKMKNIENKENSRIK